MESRKLKIVNISSGQILSLFIAFPYLKYNQDWCINTWRIKDLPKDAEVIDVHYNPSYAAWQLTIRSEEYPEVPIHEVIPILEMEHVTLIKQVGIYVKKEKYEPLF